MGHNENMRRRARKIGPQRGEKITEEGKVTTAKNKTSNKRHYDLCTKGLQCEKQENDQRGKYRCVDRKKEKNGK